MSLVNVAVTEANLWKTGGGIIKTYGMKGNQQKYPKDCEYVENANIRMPGLGDNLGMLLLEWW